MRKNIIVRPIVPRISSLNHGLLRVIPRETVKPPGAMKVGAERKVFRATKVAAWPREKLPGLVGYAVA